jgi:hypothetical protein
VIDTPMGHPIKLESVSLARMGKNPMDDQLLDSLKTHENAEMKRTELMIRRSTVQN